MGELALKTGIALLASVMICLGCGEAGTDQPSTTASEEQSLPPGFLDEAPPPPTSATEILGGGTLVLPDGSFVEDSLLIITDGKLVAWGKRGDVDVPNDSVGFDLRGKWIQAAELSAGTAADLKFSERTLGSSEVGTQVIGGYRDGVLTLPED